jgi:CheY-like chemotaxis protein
LVQQGVYARDATSGSSEAAVQRKPDAVNRLLLVEDETLVRMLAREVFQDDGFEVLEAKDGDQAIRMIDDMDRLDLLVTDVRMPGQKDGVDVARHAGVRFPRLPVIVATGYAANIRERLEELAPSAVLVEKPYRLERLAALALSLIASRREGR